MLFPYETKDCEGVTHKKRCYTLDEAADQLQIPVESLQDWILNEKLQGIEQDGTYWINHEELLQAQCCLTEESKNRNGSDYKKEIVLPTKRWETTSQSEEQKHTGLKNPLALPDPGPQQTQHKWKSAFEKAIAQLRKMKKPFSYLRLQKWFNHFFQMIDQKKRQDIRKEKQHRQVSVKLGFMTGKNELFCDFCEINDRFFAGAIFADIYVEGTLKWMMCPNCLSYCRQQANGSMEQNIRARFHQLAVRLEREAQRARKLSTSETFQVPALHEWDAWETASIAMQEAAASYCEDSSEPPLDPSSFEDFRG
ncbi:hypothetical protein [Melghirimyces algeriensis]|uniref:Helix-turn-helix domain-containing protein n=1 Tax=Melghirimyces algeriensis TaxID=910412 RepID=A0A521EQT2_9BACL|nr:hypothetical protein [Melghirimyces algeriensis]SMO86303.1 hypothetical protein SAMN06264849_11058 [Melghirimyces algeriensis]